MLDTPPKTTIFRDQKVKADSMSCSEGNGLVERSRTMTYKEGHVLLEVSRRSRLVT